MARAKKLTDQQRVGTIRAIVISILDDLTTGKKTPELLNLLAHDVCHILALIDCPVEDHMEIARLWVKIEGDYLLDKAVNNGSVQLRLPKGVGD